MLSYLKKKKEKLNHHYSTGCPNAFNVLNRKEELFVRGLIFVIDFSLRPYKEVKIFLNVRKLGRLGTNICFF